MNTENIYKETYRPQFHFTAKKGWLNDPNGMVFHKGEYHLFFQHYPDGLVPTYNSMHWGHAVSKDMVHWTELPIVFYPDENGAAWSGSAVADIENTSGFKTGKEDVLVAAYTGEEHGQCIAYSNDLGRTWEKYSRNPVIPFFPDRDPKVIWHGPTGKWVMALYAEKTARSGQKGTAFFSSDDLKSWTYMSEVPGFYECPDFFELPVDNSTSHKRWVLVSGNGDYLIGAFDGNAFITESGPHKADFGANFYATQTFSGIPAEDGRRIQIAWMNGGVYPDMPFNQQMSFPCELTLRTCEDGIRLFRYPVKEIESLYKTEHRSTNLTLLPKQAPHKIIEGELLDIDLVMNVGDAAECGIILRGQRITYNQSSGIISVLGKEAVMGLEHGSIKLRILLDKTSIELFGNNGEISMSSCFVPELEEKTISGFAEGGAATITHISINELHSAWQ